MRDLMPMWVALPNGGGLPWGNAEMAAGGTPGPCSSRVGERQTEDSKIWGR
jgi:hypothetical protein